MLAEFFKSTLQTVAAALFVLASTSCSDADGGKEDSYTWDITDAEVELYQYSNAVIPSQYYTVRVNGEDSFVIPTVEHQITTFGCSGEVLVEVSSNFEKITEAEVLPKSKNYKYQVVNDIVQLYLSPGDKAVIEINGSEDCDLFVFVNPVETGKPSESDSDVTYYKAGTVTNIGSIVMKSGQTVYIEGGAVVYGRITCSDGASDLTIGGYGILDARGLSGRGIQLNEVENLTIDGLLLINDINWSTFIAAGNNIDINNYKVVAVYNTENSSGCENDALDLLGCRNATVTDCFGYAHDDVFCVKSRKWAYKGVVDNILFEDCIAWNYRSGNSFIIGGETDYDISGVTYRNCVSIHSAGNPSNTLNRGGLSVHHCAGGHISDILFENIVLEDCKEYGIHIDIRHSYIGNLGNDENNNAIEYSPGTMDGITLRNIDIVQAPEKGNFLFGYDETHKILNVVFDNVCQEGTEITADNIETFFDPTMYYSRAEQFTYNLEYVEYSFE